jgi:YtoQ family protein
MNERIWKVYLSGEIHSDWREQIAAGVVAAELPVELSAPITEHSDSDDCGVAIFGAEPSKVWHDRKGAQLNSIRTGTLIGDADIVVVRFGEKYKQWNAAFDAGYAAAKGKPIITLHPPEHDHALKEVDAAASAVARDPGQIVQALAYIIRGELPGSARINAAAE